MIAGIQIAIVLQRYRFTAHRLKCANARVSPDIGRKHGIKELDEYFADVPMHPLIEDFDKKSAPLSRPDRALRYPCSFLVARLIVALDHGNELNELSAEGVAKKAINLKRLKAVGDIDRAEYIELHSLSLH